MSTDDPTILDDAQYGKMTVRGVELTVRLNPEAGVLRDLMGGGGKDRDIGLVLKGLDRVIIEHPFKRKDGTPATVEQFPADLMFECLEAYGVVYPATFKKAKREKPHGWRRGWSR